jgi:fucose 4-O-acetylase-like acetyltransferase
MSTQKRNIWLDNVKGFLIICVVAGHFLESGIDYHSNMCKSLFLFIYSFHMPLFVFASGLMCEHAIKTKERFCKKLAGFAGLFVLLKLLIFPFQRLNNPDLTFSFVKTDGVPWYLFAMCVFYTCAYLLRNMDKRKVLAISFFIALMAGYDNGIGDVFAFSRCLVFFPWFVLGWMSDVNKLEFQLHRRSMRILAPIIVLTFFILCRVNIDSFYIFRRFFTGRSSYEALLDDAGEIGILFRLSAYMITFIIGVCILSIIPRHKIFHLDALGKESMSIYFFHRPVLFYLEYVEAYPFLYQHFHGWANILWLIIAIILVIILAQPLFEKPFKIYNAWIQQRVHVS